MTDFYQSRSIEDVRIEALEAYLTMEARSLKKLHCRWSLLVSDTPRPSLTSLKRWSKRYKWRDHLEKAMQALTRNRVRDLVAHS